MLTYLLTVVALSIVFIVFGSSRLKIHPFLLLIAACYMVGFATHMDPATITSKVTSGFGSMLQYIGLIVVFGTIIGVLLNESGAMLVIADYIGGLAGKKRPVTTMTILGAVVSVPVFCDSGFVLLSRISRALARKQGVGSAPSSLALAGGLYATHTLVPPTPGPVAVAGNLGAASVLGTIILTGIFISIPVLAATVFAAKKLGKGISIKNDITGDWVSSEKINIWWASLPIVVPIVLIAFASISDFLEMDSTGFYWIAFVGNPTVALFLGVVLGIWQLSVKVSIKKQSTLIEKGLVQAGPILLITGAGGAFGQVLKETNLAALIEQTFSGFSFGLFSLLIMAYVIAAVLKSAQGSSTAALVISSSLLAPFVVQAGLYSPFDLSLLVMAFGAGAMTVSHANDSYFWVVTKFSGMSMENGYKAFTPLNPYSGPYYHN
jgi:GntP family gluconate:H+ symporter